jgi:hypothetical protein
MTIAIGIGLIVVGGILASLYPVNNLGVMLVIAGAIVVVLRSFGALAADLPVPPPGVTQSQMRAAIADQERRRRAPRKKFEDLLSSPIGKGRME